MMKFQLTHPWGCDWNNKISIPQDILFQLTHPWGCDTNWGKWCKVSNYFNSHTREGVTEYCNFLWFVCCYFNSHTREGVTGRKKTDYLNSYISTHTPVRVWLWYSGKRLQGRKFQLTHPWGCDCKIKEKVRRWKISTHTPVRVWLKNIIVR